jgi:Na+-transporting methylmalonyl-CoA/oxaloacetate decarboxylase gamma subunit
LDLCGDLRKGGENMIGLDSFYTALFMMAVVFLLLFVIYLLISASSFLIRRFEAKADKPADGRNMYGVRR